MPPDAWNPTQYERFKDERTRPFFDLLDLVEPHPDMQAIDLGCGTGELTAALHTQLKAATTEGWDSSPAMLARSQKVTEPGLTFTLGDLRQFDAQEKYDLIFSNAALQWVPGHAELIPKLARGLRPGGQLAIQMPANHDYPTHVIAAEVAGESPFREALGGYARTSPVLLPEDYALLLNAAGFTRLRVRLEVYLHPLGSREEVVEWVKGTLLTDYEKRLSPELFERFLGRYRERLLPQLSDQRPFPYPFKRILLWGQYSQSAPFPVR